MLLVDPADKTVTTDLTAHLEITTKEKIRASKISDPKKISLIIIIEKNCPELYGLLKIHKPDVLLRTVVSAVGSALLC